MAVRGDSLLVGGAFRLVSTAGDTLSHFLALFSAEDHTLLSAIHETEPMPAIVAARQVGFGAYPSVLAYYEGAAGGFVSYFFSEELALLTEEVEDAVVNGIYGPRGLLFGQYEATGYNDRYVISTVPGESASAYWPIVQANGPVTAIAEFQNELIVAGTFTEIDGESLRHLTRADLLITDAEEMEREGHPRVSTDGRSLFFSRLPFPSEWNLDLYDQQGRRVWTKRLSITTDETIVSPPKLPAAAYIYRLWNEQGVTAGQVMLNQ